MPRLEVLFVYVYVSGGGRWVAFLLVKDVGLPRVVATGGALVPR